METVLIFGLILAIAWSVVKIWDALKEAVKRQRPPPPRVAMVNDGSSITELRNTPAGQLGAALMTGKCPDCGHDGFYEGPSGGASVNIYCKNPDCRSAFNFTNMFGEGHGERIGKAPDSIYK